MGVAVNVTDEPAQLGLLPEVIAIETDGVTLGFTVTDEVDADAEHPLLLVAVRVKVPLVVPMVTVGLCDVAFGLKEHPLGPVQE